MKNYFFILLAAGIYGSVASVLSDGSSLGKYVKYVSALVCVILVISPLKDIVHSISFTATPPLQPEVSQSEITEKAVDMTEKQIAEKIKDKFGIIPTSVCIEIDRDGKILLSVDLNETDEGYRKEIDEYVKSICQS